MATRTSQRRLDPWADPIAAVEEERRADRMRRLEATRSYLRRRRDTREDDLRQLGVPEGAWRDVSIEIGAVIDPEIEPFENLQIPIASGGFDVRVRDGKKQKVVGRVPQKPYQRWRAIGGPGDCAAGDRADWLAAEVWVITNLLAALESGDLQHVFNLSRLLMVCEANWRWPERFAEVRREENAPQRKGAGDARGRQQAEQKATRQARLQAEYLCCFDDHGRKGTTLRQSLALDDKILRHHEKDRSAAIIKAMARRECVSADRMRELVKPNILRAS